MSLALTLGLATVRLTWIWACEDRALAGVADTFLGDGPRPSLPLEPPETREPRWWSSAASHLLLRALAARQDGLTPDRGHEAEDLLRMARSVSPLDRAVRLNLLAAGAEERPQGVSRDDIALHLLGNRLRDEGRTDEAIACYRHALALAAASRPGLSEPHFYDDPRIARFALPLEGRMTGIVRDLLAASRDDPGRWAEALPRSPLAALAAYRILHERRDPSAGRAAELVLSAREPGDGGVPGSLSLAAQGEVLALEGRLREAEDRYRRAVAGDLPGEVRRLLAFNLSDLEARLGNHREMVAAWDLARGPDLHDPINVELARVRMSRSRRGASRPSGAPGADPTILGARRAPSDEQRP